jgi:hypothetical protein
MSIFNMAKFDDKLKTTPLPTNTTPTTPTKNKNKKTKARVLAYSNSFKCDESNLISNATYSDGECVNITNHDSWKFSCSGGLDTAITEDNGNTLNADDVVFLVIAFVYLVFVVILLSVMFCYISGTICVKRNKVFGNTWLFCIFQNTQLNNTCFHIICV